MAEGMHKKIRHIFGCTGTLRESAKNNAYAYAYASESKKMNFLLSNEGFLYNGRVLLEERVSLFHGTDFLYQCVWDTRPALVSLFGFDVPKNKLVEECCREIAIATEMGIHKNVLKLLACCLETETPVLIYEYVENGFLSSMIYKEKNQTKAWLGWKNRLRIAYEISHAVAYLHTAFPTPIIHTNLKPAKVMLDENNAAKLMDFSSCVSIPKGKTSVETSVLGTYNYMDPEYIASGKVAEKTDVYSFGVLFVELLTYQRAQLWNSRMKDRNHKDNVPTDTLVRKIIEDYSGLLMDAYLAASEAPDEDRKQFRASTELGLKCVAEEVENRPTMTEVATQLKSIIA